MGIGIWQILLIVILIFIIFGAGKIPRIMYDIAKAIKIFNKEMHNNEYNADKNLKDDNNNKS